MKKKYTIIGIAAVLAVALSIWLLTRPEILGSMSHTYAAPETSSSHISFLGEAGNRVKLSFASNIERGDLNITISDSNGTVITQLARATELETFLTFDYSDTYTLKADCSDFIGSYKIAVLE